MPSSIHPDIGTLIFKLNVDGIKALLNMLQPKNHQAQIIFLKEYADETALILQIIFTQSLNTHTLPQDWLIANITSVFKK